MKKPIVILLVIFTSLFSCTEYVDVDTANIGKVEVPISIAMPLMDGVLTIQYDSLFTDDILGSDIMEYENGVAYFKYDTVIDFFDEMNDFLQMEDIDFSNISSFSSEYAINFETNVFEVPYSDVFEVSDSAGDSYSIEIDTTISINPQDTFRNNFGSYAIFTAPSDVENYTLNVISIGDHMDLNLEFDVFTVDIKSGKIDIDIRPSDVDMITSDSMYMTPSFRYVRSDSVSIDESVDFSLNLPLFQDCPKLPVGVTLKIEVSILSLVDSDDAAFYHMFEISTLDTGLQIDLAGYSFQDPSGSGLVDLDVNSFISVTTPEEASLIPLPDTLFYDMNITDLDFEKVVFDYGIDTAVVGTEQMHIDAFDALSDNFDIEGFVFSDPQIEMIMHSNLGFSTLLEITQLAFTDNDNILPISENDTEKIMPKKSADPNSIDQLVEVNIDSLLLDVDNSHLSDYDLLNVDGLLVDYMVIVNPESVDGTVVNNFFYNYDESLWADRYVAKLSASIKMPFEFSFNSITLRETFVMTLDTEALDSVVELRETDSVEFAIKLMTMDLPFSATAQFYFGDTDDGELEYVDSMFAEPLLLLPASSELAWDSVEWTAVIDMEKYDNMILSDSLTMEIQFDMNEDEYFLLEEAGHCQIGYKFSVKNASFLIKQD